MSRHNYDVTVTTFKWKQYDGGAPPTNLSEFVDWARDMLNAIPVEHRKAAQIKIDGTISYDQALARVEISYTRSPTAAEVASAVAAARQIVKTRMKQNLFGYPSMSVQPVAMPPYGDATAMVRIAELEKALNNCMEWAASDCEHEACAGVIKVARDALGGAIRD